MTYTLVGLGFKLNPCDFCVANATTKVKKITIAHFVDDTKASHVEKVVVRQVHNALESKFGPMKVVTGKEHDFLGSRTTCRNDRRFKIDLNSHLPDVADDF